MNVRVEMENGVARVIPIRSDEEELDEDELGEDEEQEEADGDDDFGDYEDLVVFLNHILHIADQTILSEYSGTKVTIEIGEEGWCIECENTEDEE